MYFFDPKTRVLAILIGSLFHPLTRHGQALESPQIRAERTNQSTPDKEKLRGQLKKAFQSAVGQSKDVVAATSVHVRHLAETAPQFPGGDHRFQAFLRSAFTLANQRSRQKGKDPVAENRAAVLALAIVLGHSRIETFVGDVSDDEVKSKAGRYTGNVSLRGRRDWTQHFFVSAGLTVAFNASMGDSVGVLKEKIDAGKGGSGFSFADLLADRAGVRFAVAATRDRKAAERMQELLIAPFSIDDVFPRARDLPEGVPDSKFQQRYGGVNGKGYKELLAEIERRLDTCRALNFK
jgi:hypothetical protein